MSASQGKRKRTRMRSKQRRAGGADAQAGASIYAIALHALCHRTGLTAGETDQTEKLGLDRAWWQRTEREVRDGVALRAEAEVTDAVVWWIAGALPARCRHAELRIAIRTRRFAERRTATAAMWPRVARAQARAMEEAREIAQGRGNTATREHGFWAWSMRAGEIATWSDARELAAMAHEDAKALEEVLGAEGADVEDLAAAVDRLENTPCDLDHERACEYAATRAIALASEHNSAENAAVQWVRAQALEHMGHVQRALRAYARCESIEREIARDRQCTGTPGVHETQIRQTSLLWRSGEPEAMREAIRRTARGEGASTGAWGRSRRRRSATATSPEATVVEGIATALGHYDRTVERTASEGTERESARATLAEAYMKAGLNERALSLALQGATDARSECRLALVSARALDKLGAAPTRVHGATTRATIAEPKGALPRALGAGALAQMERPRSAETEAMLALALDREHSGPPALRLDAGTLSMLANVLETCERPNAAARIDARLATDLAVRRSPDIAMECLERTIGRGQDIAGALDRTLDASACAKTGVAHIAVLMSDALRARAAELSPKPDTGGAERLRTVVRTVRTRTDRDTLGARLHGQTARVQAEIAGEPRELTRVCARTPEVVSHALRTLHITQARARDGPDESASALEAGACARVATLFVEWALRCPSAGAPHEETVRIMLEKLRSRPAEIAQNEWPDTVDGPGATHEPDTDTQRKGEDR